ncbi:MAG: chemotaxis response regulator protein-glutamate methylesterase [Pontiellaceae bacterium]|nr:chemotaxis response regulator protein-glutamate methylesterase [Pontiellaceae bacterium]MBN2785900.1 chemotaxis response regulator protein-glutamate methylesterase [Pontiellaceae bacterium]
MNLKVLIVDDSAVVRQTLADILQQDPDIAVVEPAADPYIAASCMRKFIPDVILLDIEMPRMDGLTFLSKIMSQHPLPVIICSSLSAEGSQTALRAMSLGAVEVIYKPKIGSIQYLREAQIRICDSVKAAARANVKTVRNSLNAVAPKLSADAMLPLGTNQTTLSTTDKVVVVGASTGGTEALRIFLEALPRNCPGIAIVQHMPENFTRSFANRLNDLCEIDVSEAKDGDRILRGRALIAPGSDHMLLVRRGGQYHVEIKAGPLVSRHRPSVDVLFRSTARYAGKNSIGIIMTGMGDDGARGIREMKDSGALTIAQDEASCVVFGMPNEAIKTGGIDEVVPLEKIPATMISLLKKMN